MKRKPLKRKRQARAIIVQMNDVSLERLDEIATRDGFMACDERCIWDHSRVHVCRWRRP